MSKWPQVRLGEISTIQKGLCPASSASTGSFPLVTTAADFKFTESPDHEGEAVCIPLVSATGHGNAAINRIHFVSGRFSIATIMAAVFPDTSRVTGRFLQYYLLHSKGRLLVPLMKGTSNVSLNIAKLRDVEVLLPPLSAQARIVGQLDDVSARLEERARRVAATAAQLSATLTAAFGRIVATVPRARFGDVAPIQRRPIAIDPSAAYSELGVRSFGRGLFDKPALHGDQLTWQKLFTVERGDLVFSNIKAWEGAFSVAQERHQGMVGSHRYLTCVADTRRATPDFLWYYLQTPEGLSQIQVASPGTADRNRTLSQKGLEAVIIPLPPLKEQLWFDALQIKIAALRRAHTAAAEEAGHLLPSLLHRAFAA